MKPITLSIEDAQTWLKAVDQTEWITMSGDYWREFFPVIARLRAQVDEWEAQATKEAMNETV